MEFDLAVIGGGPGGYAAAIRASQLGAKTVLFEKDRLGGICLNKGCIPTKLLLSESVKVAMLLNNDYGLVIPESKIDLHYFVRKKDALVDRLRGGITQIIESNNILVEYGLASFVDANTISIKKTSEKNNVYAKKIIIAAGSKAKRIQLDGGDGFIKYSDEVLNLKALPKSIAIIGGGVIGLEFASIFNNLGSKVFILEAMDRILPGADYEIAQLLHSLLENKGIKIFTPSQIGNINKTSENEVLMNIVSDNKESALKVNMILCAIGRSPCYEQLNLKAANIIHDQNGIDVNTNLQTSTDHIYAIGDVTKSVRLAHLASAQGVYAAEHAFMNKSEVCLNYVPHGIYTDPEVASVGFTEDKLVNQGENKFKVAKIPLNANGRALVDGYEEGLIKLLYEPHYGEILGVHIIAPHAADLIAEATLAMRSELTVEELATTIHAHPTISESLMEAAKLACGAPINWI